MNEVPVGSEGSEPFFNFKNMDEFLLSMYVKVREEVFA